MALILLAFLFLGWWTRSLVVSRPGRKSSRKPDQRWWLARALSAVLLMSFVGLVVLLESRGKLEGLGPVIKTLDDDNVRRALLLFAGGYFAHAALGTPEQRANLWTDLKRVAGMGPAPDNVESNAGQPTRGGLLHSTFHAVPSILFSILAV